MNNKRNFIIDLISSIDESIINENLQKRFVFWSNKQKHRSFRNPLIPILSAAVCLAVIFASLAFIIPGFFEKTDTRQVPIYQGMTVSNKAPEASASVCADSAPLLFERLSAHIGKVPSALGLSASIGGSAASPVFRDETDDSGNVNGNGNGNNGNGNDNNGNGNGNNGNGNGNNQGPSVNGSDVTYYAQKNEDIYIYIHLSNPDEFEILSFTLNEVKYSAYMFEDGSDLETLILKYNVGDVEGEQSYTIDAIKYVDGEKIKDVRMVGDKTVKVLVGSSDRNVNFNARFEGWDLIISPVWESSFAGEKKFLSLSVYDGDKLIKSCNPNATVISGLPENSKLLLVATYAENGNTITQKSVIETPKQSEGLSIIGGYVSGIGSCSDTVLYINMPVDKEAFICNTHIEKVYFGSGVTSIEWQAFLGCSALKEITFAEGLKEINEGAFAQCPNLRNFVLPSSLTKLGDVAFVDCLALTEIEIPKGVGVLCNKGNNSPIVGCKNLTKIYIKNNKIVIRPGDAHNLFDPETENYLPTPFGVLFEQCRSLRDVYFNGTLAEWRAATSEIPGWCCFDQEIIIHCTDGNITITAAFSGR